MTREESLINELRRVAFEDGEYIERRQAELIAFFIIGREKLLLEKIGKPLMRIKEQNMPESIWKTAIERMPTLQAIDEALAIINERLAIIEKEQTNNKEN